MKPRFNSLRAALAWIAAAGERAETRIWQTMLEQDIKRGGGWD